jgi:hypothetical protein
MRIASTIVAAAGGQEEQVKIEDLLLTQYAETPTKNKAGQTDGQEFAKTLAQAVGSTSSSTTVSGTNATASLMEASMLGRIMATGTKGVEPVEQIEKALGLLDQFSMALSDPSRTLKQVAPLVEDLEAESVKLGRLSQELSGDNGLKALLNETAVLAGVEAAKFKRGDYV